MSTHHDFSEAPVRRMVRQRLDGPHPPGMGHRVVEHDGTVIGPAHLRPSAEFPGGLVEIDWYPARPHRGGGHAAEAAGRLPDHGLVDLAAPAVRALIHESNQASPRSAARQGFLDVGVGTHYGGDPHRVHVVLPA